VASTIQYRPGALLDHANVNPIDWYSGIAQEADVTIAVVGLDNMLEGEEGESLASPAKGDRDDIGLPAHQIDFLKKMRRNANKLVVVVTGGSPIAMPEVHEMADALLFVWYPGEQGGRAVADVLFGDYNPSGKLPLTFPKSLDQLPPYDVYAMAGRTYRYMSAEPLYPFGFGLSYTRFAYGQLGLSVDRVSAGQSLRATLWVENKGSVTGTEVLQLYITDLEASVDVPLYALKGFQHVTLEPGEKKRLTFTVTPDMMKLINQQGRAVLEPGRFKLSIGGSCPHARATTLGATPNSEATFVVN
jgi:beta-glucosidase